MKYLQKSQFLTRLLVLKPTTSSSILRLSNLFNQKTLEFWTDGYFITTVGKHGDEEMIANYVKKQEMWYRLTGQK